MVRILAPMEPTVAVGVGPPRIGSGQELEARPEAVAIGVLAAVADAVAVCVGPTWVETGNVFLAVRQPVAIGVLATVGDSVAIRVGASRAGEAAISLPGGREAGGVGIRRPARDRRHRRRRSHG